MKLNKRAQSIMEYVVLMIIVLGVFIAMKDYIKRGFQGRWKSAVDDLGDQYDPRLVNASINHVMITNSNTTIVTTPDTNGYFTNRTDSTQSTETKTGFIAVGDSLNEQN